MFWRHEGLFAYFCVNIGLAHPVALALRHAIFHSGRETDEALRLYLRIERACHTISENHNDSPSKIFRAQSQLGALEVATHVNSWPPCSWSTSLLAASFAIRIQPWSLEEITFEMNDQPPGALQHRHNIGISELEQLLQPWLSRPL